MRAGDGVRRVTECRVCGKSDWQEVATFGPQPLASGFLEPAESYDDEPYYPLDVVCCRSCRLMSLTHVVDKELLYRTYPYTMTDPQTILRHVRVVAALCRDRFGTGPGDLVVEIGSNTGRQLLAFQDLGLRTVGIDPARDIAAIAEQRGVPTVAEFFDTAVARSVRESSGRARLVLGRHVFAHIDDVAETLAGVHHLLAPDGVFVIEVPYLVDMLQRNEFDTVYHEHLSYFSVGTLSTLFRRHGLRILDVERLPIHGGSILVAAGPEHGPRQVRPVVAELLDLERRFGLGEDEAFDRFAANIARVRTEYPALVRDLAGQGHLIAGYGAPAKGNTLLNVCGLGAAEITFCCDTTAFKQGKVLPGTHLPVHAPEYALTHVPDYFLLLAWNYTDEILRKEHAYLANGGRFVIPNPTPSIVTPMS
jgi:SAM-dependent methyltransferase